MPLERRLRHSLHTPKHKCYVMLDRLFWHLKMRFRLTAAPLIEGGAA